MLGEKANSILHEAVASRERECSSVRKTALVLATIEKGNWRGLESACGSLAEVLNRRIDCCGAKGEKL